MNLALPSNPLLLGFWAGMVVLAGYALGNAGTTPLPVVATGFLLGACALAPAYLWCAQKTRGLPIFPLMALTYVWTYALPLLTQQRQVAEYDTDGQVQAALTTVLFLVLGTVTWWCMVRTPGDPPPVFLALRDDVAGRLFLIGLAVTAVFQMLLQSNWLAVPWGVFSILIAANGAISTLAVIVLSYRLGQRRLPWNEIVLFLSLFSAWLVITTSTLLLVGAMAMTFIAVVAYTLGRGKPPLTAMGLALAVFGFLHIGKEPVRAAYWAPGAPALQPTEYLRLYLRWFGSSVEALPTILRPREDRQSQSLSERSSLIQMILLVQSKTPSQVPYLAGRTYAIIPGLLVPRIFDPDKLRSHEGTYMLSVAYGLQTEKETNRTTIGFGLLSEAYANFGYAGVAGLALLLGWGSGALTRWSQGVPLTSLRGLASLLGLAVAIQTEYTAGVLVATLFQSGVVLLVAVPLLMRPYTLRPLSPTKKRPLPTPP